MYVRVPGEPVVASTPALSRQLVSFRVPADAASGGISVGGHAAYRMQVFRWAMACGFKVALPGEDDSHLTDAHPTLTLADRFDKAARWLADEYQTVVPWRSWWGPWWRRTDR